MTRGEVGNLIRQRRDHLLLKQEDVAEMAGVSSKFIYLMEKGKGNASLDTLQKIFEVLGLELKVAIKKVEA